MGSRPNTPLLQHPLSLIPFVSFVVKSPFLLANST
jgi:hypothetical protein